MLLKFETLACSSEIEGFKAFNNKSCTLVNVGPACNKN